MGIRLTQIYTCFLLYFAGEAVSWLSLDRTLVTRGRGELTENGSDMKTQRSSLTYTRLHHEPNIKYGSRVSWPCAVPSTWCQGHPGSRCSHHISPTEKQVLLTTPVWQATLPSPCLLETGPLAFKQGSAPIRVSASGCHFLSLPDSVFPHPPLILSQICCQAVLFRDCSKGGGREGFPHNW